MLGVFIPAGIEHIIIGPESRAVSHRPTVARWHALAPDDHCHLFHAWSQHHAFARSAGHRVSADDISRPIIALSIVFVGADNLLVQRDSRRATATPRHPRDIRAWVAGVFGLVHGFGFASVLKELGLPLTALGWSLFSFNLGVEIGQLAIVAAVATALAAIQRRNAATASRLAFAGSVIVMVAGAYWFVNACF